MNISQIPKYVMLVLLSACGGHAFELRAPTDFVEFKESPPFAWRATSANGAVLAVREEENPRGGTVSYWVDTLTRMLRDDNGYALTETVDVTAATGQTGKQLRFSRDARSKTYVFWVTVFTKEDKVIVIEAGGEREIFTPQQAAIEEAIRSIRIP